MIFIIFFVKKFLLDILEDSKLIENTEEAAFLLEARQGSIKLIAQTRINYYFYLARKHAKRRALTRLATFTASDDVLPLLVYPNKLQ